MAKKDFGHWVERRGQELRQIGGAGPFARLDPWRVADKMNVRVIEPHQIRDLSPESLSQLLEEDSDAWSAGTLVLPEGLFVVVFNPKHARTRQNVTVLEELSHIHLAHKPSKLLVSNHAAFRTWNDPVERQAYGVAAAALLPECVIKGAKTLGYTAGQVARFHDVSIPLVLYRARLLGVHLR